MGKHIKFDVRGVPIEPEGGWPQVKPPTKEELKDKKKFPQMPPMRVIQNVNDDPSNENTQPAWKENTFDDPKPNVEYPDPFNWYSTGQMILDFQMPMDMVNRLNHIYELTQKIQSGVHLPFIIDGKPTKVFKLPNMSSDLEGKLKQQFSVYLDNENKKDQERRHNNHNFLPDDIHEWIKDRIHQYLQFTKTPYVGIRTNSAWVNDFEAGEYSPIHRHRGSNQIYRKPFNDDVPYEIGLIGMLALKLPSHMGEEVTYEEDDRRNGHVEFIGKGGGQFSSESILFKYEVGQFLVFPYDLLHCVYPHFNKEETRRTMPVNVDVYLQKV